MQTQLLPTSRLRRVLFVLCTVVLLIAVCVFLCTGNPRMLLAEDYIISTEESIQTEPTEPEETYPPHITNEVYRISEIIQAQQTDRSFTFITVSDTHECPDNSAANQQTGQAAALLRKTVDIDFAALLGDVTSGSRSTTIEEGIREIQAVNSYLEKAFSGIPNFRAVGNHDLLVYSYPQNQDYLDNDELFPYIGAYNSGATFGSDTGGYCYRDFDDFQTRVILLNTSDTEDFDIDSNNPHYRMSGRQLQWFAKSLDLSGKTDAKDWNILLLSHVSVDFHAFCDATGPILDAYIQGTPFTFTWEGHDISYDFTNRNGAAIIANIHGHEHLFSSGYIYAASPEGYAYRTPILRICMPNASFTRTNDRDPESIAYEPDRAPYVKVADSVQSTSFNVITIDPDSQKIYCTNYGAGYDRTFTYDIQEDPPVGTFTNMIPTAEIFNSGNQTPLDGTGYRNGAYLSSYGFYGREQDMVMTGGIPYRITRDGLPPTIYIWGADLTSHDRVRFFILNSYKSQCYLNVSGDAIADYFSIEKLGDFYYRLTPTAYEDSSMLYETLGNRAARYIAWSLEGYGKELIITLDEPIIN